MTISSSQLAQRLSRSTGIDADKLASLIADTASVVTRQCADLNTVAIPGFGNFSGEKFSDSVDVDPISGKRTLLPPRIEMLFRPSVVLRKRLEK